MSNNFVQLCVDIEAERDTNWSEGTQVLCKDTGRSYKLIIGKFELIQDIVLHDHIKKSEMHRTITYNSDCGFVEILI